MTTFRCPYCRHVFEGPHAQCPACGKTMNIPTHLTGKSARERKRARARIQRNADRQRRVIGAHEPPIGRKPAHLLLILAFMSVLGLLLVGRARIASIPKQSRPPPESIAQDELNILRAAVELFRRDCRRYPREEEGLTVLLANPGNTSWNGPYVNVVKRDPWRRDYVYEVESNRVAVLSLGPDGERGSPDDLHPLDWEALLPPPE